MTEFQRIKEELISLNWVAVQGDGDHIKFTKDGGKSFPIVVSMRVGGPNRSLQNTISYIRKAEPEFKLGRPAKKKETEVKEEKETTNLAGLPPFIQPGGFVRWVTPEKRDWNKLNDNTSVMNQKYEIQKVEPMGKTFLVTIQQYDTEHEPFSVDWKDIETWNLRKCPECGRQLPVSLFFGKGEIPTMLSASCRDCKEKAKAKVKLNEDPIIKAGKEVDKMEKICDKYKGIPLSNIPMDERKKLAEQTVNLVNNIPGKMKSKMADRILKLAGGIADEKKTNIFEAWQKFKTMFVELYCRDQKISPIITEHASEVIAADKAIKPMAYNVRIVKDWQIIEITNQNWDIIKSLWKHSPVLYKEFDQVNLNGQKLCFVLSSPANEFRQYILDQRKNVDEAIKSLEKTLTKKELETDCLSRARVDALCPPLDDVKKEFDNILEAVKSVVGKKNSDKLSKELTVNYRLELNREDDDKHPFETMQAHVHMEIIVDNINGDGSVMKAMLASAPDLCEKYKKTVTVIPLTKIVDLSEDSWQSFGYEFYEKKPETIEAEKDSTDTNGKTVTINEEDFVKITEYASTNKISMADAVSELINNNTKNTTKMDNERKRLSYEATNPNSSNPTAGALKTRELLKELIERGVRFQKVTIPVRDCFVADIDEIMSL